MRFLLRQKDAIKRGGVRALMRRLWIVFATGLAIIPVIAMRLLRPIIPIRVGGIRGDRIGHFLQPVELYLSQRDTGLWGRKTLDLFYYDLPICNHQVKKMWDRVLRTSSGFKWIGKANQLLPGGSSHLIPWMSEPDLDPEASLAQVQTHLWFTPEEEHKGLCELARLGIPENAPFVCFHARDPSYLDATYPPLTTTGSWRYHDFRDSNIEDYLDAASMLVDRGYFALRTGAVVEKRLAAGRPNIIDYANMGRTEFMDVYLGAKCKFYIVSTTGINAIPVAFRTPIAYVNWHAIQHAPTWDKNSLFIPMKIRSKKDGRIMGYREILDLGIGHFQAANYLEEFNVEMVENTSEEITALTLEMDDRLNNRWTNTDEDEDLQRKFWSIMREYLPDHVFNSKIGAEFLRQNRELLD